jgi:calcineurin-like phosphoesterase family protein
MDEALIRNWNSVVGPDDLVYHLGDILFGRDERDFDRVLNRLNGRIILIKGNHDRMTMQFRNKFLEYHHSGMLETKIEGQQVTLCHYAMRVWNKSHRGAFHLYGHSHGTLPDDPNSLSFDVGVDCHNYTPITWEKVKQIMAKKTFKPVDHHGDSD